MSENFRQILSDIITKNPLSFGTIERFLLKNYPNIHKEINEYWDNNYNILIPKNYSEKIYSYLNEKSTICEKGNQKSFVSFKKGYVNCGTHCFCAVTKYTETMQRKYGVDSPLQNKDIFDKVKDIWEKKYGTRIFNEINPDKKIKTCIEKYGVDNPLKNKDIFDKAKKTLFEKTGYEYNFKNPEKQKQIQEKWAKINPNNQKTYLRTKEDIIKDRTDLLEKKFPDHSHIILNPELFTEQLKLYGCGGLSTIIGCCSSSIYKWIKKYNLKEFQNKPSYYEQVLENIFTDFDIKVVRNSFKIIPPKQIDIYLPELKIGIEFCGLRWHGERVGRGENYHLNKMNLANQQDIRLIQIFQDEWDKNPNIVRSILINMIGKSKNIIHARKCVIEKISSKEANIFLEDNHLQGKCIGQSACYVLKHNNEIISCMTFSIKKDKIELKRFVNKIDYSIPGGASKLFNSFIKEYNPTKIFSYCDLRYFTGNIYSKLGFKYKLQTKPGYHYTKDKKRFHRLNFTKKYLVSQGYNSTKTEKNIMFELGYDRIWDCGHQLWEWE